MTGAALLGAYAISSSPALMLVLITIGAALLLVEVALPTYGVAGASAVALAVVAGLAVHESGDPWWPLLMIAVGLAWWAVMLARRSGSVPGRMAGAALFAIGGIGFGLFAADPLTVGVAAAGTAALYLGYPTLLHAMSRLLDQPAQVGMDALVGQNAEVMTWSGAAGTVRVGGAIWKARGAVELPVGGTAMVRGYDGMTLEVALAAAPAH